MPPSTLSQNCPQAKAANACLSHVIGKSLNGRLATGWWDNQVGKLQRIRIQTDNILQHNNCVIN